MAYQTNKNNYSTLNATTTPLTAGNTWTGTYELAQFPAIAVSCYADTSGTIYVDFSPDGINADSVLSYAVAASTNEVHRLTVTKKYFRVRFTCGAVSQSAFRLQTIQGQFTTLTSALNQTIQSDQDTIAVRPLDFNLMVAEGLYQNRSNTIKDGLNFDIDTGTTPEDLCNQGGTYPGFPSSPDAAEIVVSGADTGTVYYSYLSSNGDLDYTISSKAITGAGTYSLGHNIWRCNFAYFVSSSSTSFNAGDITIRHTATPSTIFCVIPTGYSQTYCGAYTVPAGSSVYLDRINGTVRGSSTGSMDGYFWYRANGESPRLRFPFVLQFGALYFDDVDYLIRIPALTDLVPRITSSSANNLSAQVSYRIIKVK